ncbi:MAG: hypothetical protein N3G76_01690 [Candidatus Micrarchaeota archaeon]|nr:hypothetical protein [Candidatus Micrarchaeota archaeon]
MVEFRGVKLSYVEAKREKDALISGLNININIDDVKAVGDDIMMDFTYSVTYAEDVGYLKVSGTVYAKDTAAGAKSIESGWRMEKKLPDDIAQPLLNLINFSSGVNGVFVARALNLAPPLVPPRIEITSKGGASARG